MVVAASCTSGMWRNVRLCVPCASQELPDGTGHVGRLQSTRRVPRVQAGLSSAASLPPLCRCIGGRVVQAAAQHDVSRDSGQAPCATASASWYGMVVSPVSTRPPSTGNPFMAAGGGAMESRWFRRGPAGHFSRRARQQQTQKQLPYKE